MWSPFNSFTRFLPRVNSFATLRLNKHKTLSDSLKFASAFKFSGDHIFPERNFKFCSSVVSDFNQTNSEKLSTFKMSPPGIKHDWRLDLSPQDLLKRTDDLINKCRQLYDKVGSVPDSDVSCETVLQVLNEADCLMGTDRYFLDSSQHISTNEGVRNASTEADRKLREFMVEIKMRKDVFHKLLILEKKGEVLKPESKRYLEKLILLGKRNGLHLDEGSQKQIKELNSKINNLAVDFMKNLNDVTTTLEFSDKELDGLPADFLQSLKTVPDSGKFEVTLKYPHYFPIMEKCKVPETRRRLEFAFNTQNGKLGLQLKFVFPKAVDKEVYCANTCHLLKTYGIFTDGAVSKVGTSVFPTVALTLQELCIDENGRILTELRKLRHELAVLLGYPSHTTYITEKLMSKSDATVKKFLTELAEKMAPLWKEEKKYLLELKEKECAELGLPFDGKLNNWDTTYYITRSKEIKYAVDKMKLREYFPFPVVKNGLLTIYQDLLGLKFEKVDGEKWHEDVELYSVSDSSSGTLLGYFFLDLFPRPNKYGHAALFELQHSFLKSDGTRQPAVGAMVANFTKPKEDKPALLDHDEVTTFFHEFGHVMHYICVEMEYPFFNLTNMERDFIEAPSQMLENWCWEKEPLLKMSSHYSDKSAIPPDVLDALIKSRVANIGFSTLRQICLALYDQTIHSTPEGDTRELYYDLVRKYTGIEPQTGTHFACHFGHLANEYDAQYYGYLWSEVYSMDMFQTRFGEMNCLNPEVGRDYRDKILRPGGTKDAHELVCSFLGREPTQEAFLKSKGLKI